MYFVHFSCFLAALVVLTSTQASASKPSHVAPYEKKYACLVQNPNKTSSSWFTSVVHSMRGVPQLRHYCKKGKKTSFKKNLNTLFSHLESKKRIKRKETKKWLRYFQQQAKKSKITLPNYPLIFAGFLLKNSGMPTFSYQKSVNIENRYNRGGTPDKAKFALDYAINNVQMVLLHLPDSKSASKRYELKDLLKKVCFTNGYEADVLGNLSKELGLPLPAEVEKELLAKEFLTDYRYTVQTHFQFANEKQVPRLLPIYLQRWQNHHLGAKKPKKNHYSYSSQLVRPSKIIDIPLADAPNRVARYHLVSMVVNRFYDIAYKKTLCHAYAVVLTKKGRKRQWTFYDDNRIYKNAKERIIEDLLPQRNQEWLYRDVYENATLFFYQLSGFKELPPPKLPTPASTSHSASRSS